MKNAFQIIKQVYESYLYVKVANLSLMLYKGKLGIWKVSLQCEF